MNRKVKCFLSFLAAFLFSAGVSFSADPPQSLWSLDANTPEYLWGHLYDTDPTPDGGAISVGYVSIGSLLSYDVIVLKTAADGTEQWRNVVGSSLSDETMSVTQTPDGGYLIAVTAWSPYEEHLPYSGPDFNSYYNAFLVRLDSTGNELWRKYFNPGVLSRAGDIASTADGNFFIAGEVWLEVPFSANFPCFMKLDPNGEVLWSTQLPDIVWSFNTLSKVLQTSDGGYAAAFPGDWGLELLRFDGAGALLWNQRLLTNAYQAPVNGFMEKGDGGFVLSGGGGQIPNSDIYWWSMAWVSYRVETDKNGNPASELIVEEVNSTPRSAFATTDGGLLIGAGSYYRKVDGKGTEQWVIQHPLPEFSFSYPIPGERYIYDLEEPTGGGYLLAGTIAAVPLNSVAWHNMFSPYLEMLAPDRIEEEEPAAISVNVSVVGAKKGKINLANNRMVHLVVYGSQVIDVTDLDLETASFAGLSPFRKGKANAIKARYKDVNRDGHADVVVDFKATKTAPEGSLLFLCDTKFGDKVTGDSGVTAVVKACKKKK